MKLSFTLFSYITKQFLISLGIVLFTFAVITMLIDVVELFRRAHNKDVSLFIIMQMVLLKFPQTVNKMMPFAILVGTVMSYSKMTRSNELVIVRSAGVSVWQFLFPAVFTAFFIGLLMILIINPISTAMLSKYERIEAKYLLGKQSFLDISDSGLWLRQRSPHFSKQKREGETIIHAKSIIGDEEIAIKEVMAFVFTADDSFFMRIDAKEAHLANDFWDLKDVIVTMPDGTAKRHDEYFLETELTNGDLYKSFASPETISFWALPAFIKTLKESGFSALYHILYWHNTLASPFFYAAMVLIAAIFSLSPDRHGRTGILITGSVIVGFVIYFLVNLVSSLGLSGGMPIIMAAWAPVIVSTLVGTGLLLHFEDG